VISLLVYVIPYILGLVILIALLGSSANFRRARRAPYFRIRRDAARAAWRWVMICIVALALAVVAIYARRTLPRPSLGSLFLAPMETLSPAVPMIPSVTPNPSLTPKNPLFAPPTITPTQPTPTVTPTPFLATVESEVTPPTNATLRVTAISSGISSDLRPVNAATTFPAGLPRLYMWIEYANMANGISWSRVLLLNGVVVRAESELWERGEEGIAYYYFDAQGGWPAGEYEIEFYIGDRLLDSRTFTVVD